MIRNEPDDEPERWVAGKASSLEAVKVAVGGDPDQDFEASAGADGEHAPGPLSFSEENLRWLEDRLRDFGSDG
jgi:hypothetical protein